MSFLSNLIKDAAPVVATIAPFVPGGQAVAVAASAKVAADQRAAAKFQQGLQQQRIRNQMAIDFSDFGGRAEVTRPFSPPTQQLGFFDRLGNVASNVGNTLLSGLESSVPSFINRAVFGQSRPQSASQGPALTTVTNVGAQESQSSGTISAGAGAVLPSLLSGARALLKSPGGQLALGGGTALAFSGMGSQPSGMRITRKMKSQARMIVNMVGGDLSAAAGILGIDENTLVMILLKRFRNDGPVVTKAALRKTKSTIRKLHSMQDVLKSITPTAAGRRRAPTKRAMSTTLIKN